MFTRIVRAHPRLPPCRHSFARALYRPEIAPKQLYSRRILSQTQPPQTVRRSAVDLRTLILAAAVSTGFAYIGVQYSSALKDDTGAARQQHAEEQGALTQGSVQLEINRIFVMAPNMPPGRPGNLTADQEAKLKEMWAQTLEFFGTPHGQVRRRQSNGSITSYAPQDGTPEKKKRRGIIPKFGKRDRSDSDLGGVDNDKHGQVKEYEQALASLTPDEIRQAFWNMCKMDHPDAILLRFLRARKWDVHAAQVMALSTLHWRLKDSHVDDDIIIRGESWQAARTQSDNPEEKKEAEDFMVQLRMGKSFLHGVDKEGRPINIVRARLHRGGEQSEKSLERYTIHMIETARMLLRPPVDTATIIFDMTGFSIANMDYTPVKFMIKVFEANYPESLGAVMVYKAPWVFSSIWNIIKRWLDPVVASKIHFASNVDELAEFIPKSQIIKEMGGDEDWTYEYVEPRPGEDAALAKTDERDKILDHRKELAKAFEEETLAWINGEDRTQKRDTIAQGLAENYWKLDPYIRGRTLLDRMSILGPMGRLSIYPEQGSAAGAAEKRPSPKTKDSDDGQEVWHDALE